jgi:MoaA/NifB/PqqE/SkfB family radical SAM enzyme
MKLEDIGFYTLTDERAKNSNPNSDLQRCEILLTGRCNFHCPYCRSVGGKDLSLTEVLNTINLWISNGLKNIRFSGGEPTLWPQLERLCIYCKNNNIKRIAVSTNGSANLELYERIIQAGVDDFSISLDACCAEDGDKMAGGVKGAWETVTNNLRWISSRVYTTVGVVLTEDNETHVTEIIKFAENCGVSDIRIIPAAQYANKFYNNINIETFNKYQILQYRSNRIKQGCTIRGLSNTDTHRCPLVLDDMAVMGNKHYPCIIYLREGGNPIGEMNSNFRKQRELWFLNHDTHKDKICKNNCLDFCSTYNNTWEKFHVS